MNLGLANSLTCTSHTSGMRLWIFLAGYEGITLTAGLAMA
nr:hypothetical protein Q903MT_gene2828 [Picea sitchensis]